MFVRLSAAICGVVIFVASSSMAMAESGITIDDVSRVAFMNYSGEVVEQRCVAPPRTPDHVRGRGPSGRAARRTRRTRCVWSA